MKIALAEIKEYYESMNIILEEKIYLLKRLIDRINQYISKNYKGSEHDELKMHFANYHIPNLNTLIEIYEEIIEKNTQNENELDILFMNERNFKVNIDDAMDSIKTIIEETENLLTSFEENGLSCNRIEDLIQTSYKKLERLTIIKNYNDEYETKYNEVNNNINFLSNEYSISTSNLVKKETKSVKVENQIKFDKHQATDYDGIIYRINNKEEVDNLKPLIQEETINLYQEKRKVRTINIKKPSHIESIFSFSHLKRNTYYRVTIHIKSENFQNPRTIKLIANDISISSLEQNDHWSKLNVYIKSSNDGEIKAIFRVGNRLKDEYVKGKIYIANAVAEKTEEKFIDVEPNKAYLVKANIDNRDESFYLLSNELTKINIKDKIIELYKTDNFTDTIELKEIELSDLSALNISDCSNKIYNQEYYMGYGGNQMLISRVLTRSLLNDETYKEENELINRIAKNYIPKINEYELQALANEFKFKGSEYIILANSLIQELNDEEWKIFTYPKYDNYTAYTSYLAFEIFCFNNKNVDNIEKSINMSETMNMFLKYKKINKEILLEYIDSPDEYLKYVNTNTIYVSIPANYSIEADSELVLNENEYATVINIENDKYTISLWGKKYQIKNSESLILYAIMYEEEL